MGCEEVTVPARAILAVLGLAVALPIGAARAQGGGPDPDAPYPIELKLGDSIELCSTGAVICPASGVICDDTSIVAVVGSAGGLTLEGVKPGTTLCSAASSSGMGVRRLFRVTVLEPPPP